MDAFAQVAGTPLGGSTPPIDMSVYGLFMQADWVVKAVMIALLLASFWSWAIIFEKMLRLRSLKKSAQSFEDTFWSGVSLEDLYDRVGAKPDDPMSSIFSAAMREWRRSVSKGLAQSATARAALRQRHLRRIVRHGVGYHERLRSYRAVQEHLACRSGARHLRGAVRHRDRPGRGHPGGRRLQHPVRPGRALCPAARGLRR